jgi:hypothetical protein
MGKRFTDTNKYKKPFIRGLQGAYKLLWDFLYHECDHAGIWIVDFEITQIYLGVDMKVNYEDAIKYFNSDEQRVIEIDNGHKWFIPSFIEFQYGVLNPENRAHNSVISILNKYNLFEKNKGLTSPLQGCKDKDKDKELDKDKEKGEKNEISEFNLFNNFRKLYPGTKRGNATEFENFKKKHKDWKQVVSTLEPSIKIHISKRDLKKRVRA